MRIKKTMEQEMERVYLYSAIKVKKQTVLFHVSFYFKAEQ
jgi:methionine salvage enolase-phosphatase E1